MDYDKNKYVEGLKCKEEEYFEFYFESRFINDVDVISKFANYARTTTMRIYPHYIEEKVKVYLFSLESWKSRGYELSQMRTCWKKREIYILTPSDNPERNGYDDLWYKKNMVHEYAHIPTLRDMPEQYPTWFKEGVVEYIAIFCTTNEILQRYSYYLELIRDMIRKGRGELRSVLSIQNETLRYCGWAYVLKYMYEVYGEKKVNNLVKAGNTFENALEKEFEITCQEFKDMWLDWAHRELSENRSVEKQV